MSGQYLTEPDLRQARAVEGSCIEVADALVPSGLNGGCGLFVGDGAVHVAQRRAAEAKTAGQEGLDAHGGEPSCMLRVECSFRMFHPLRIQSVINHSDFASYLDIFTNWGYR
jgi:hypothetical protein